MVSSLGVRVTITTERAKFGSVSAAWATSTMATGSAAGAGPQPAAEIRVAPSHPSLRAAIDIVLHYQVIYVS